MENTTISCFVSKDYRIVANDKKDQSREYEFYLEIRRLRIKDYLSIHPFPVEFRHDAVARNFFDERVGTPEKLMEFVKTAHLSKAELAKLLVPEIRQMFLNVCAILEKEATDRCGSSGEPCLEDGCAFEGTNEVCLNAVLLSEGKCLKACIDIWISKFEDPKNRIDIWRR